MRTLRATNCRVATALTIRRALERTSTAAPRHPNTNGPAHEHRGTQARRVEESADFDPAEVAGVATKAATAAAAAANDEEHVLRRGLNELVLDRPLCEVRTPTKQSSKTHVREGKGKGRES